MSCLTVKMTKHFRAFLRDERGATAIEYAMIASGIFLAIVLAVHTMTSTVNDTYNMISSQVVKSVL